MRFFMFLAAFAGLAACTPQSVDTPTSETPPPIDPAIETLTVDLMRATDQGPGQSVGTVTIREGASGAVFDLNLTGLPPGTHGFHVHQMPSCEAMRTDGRVEPAAAAGDHWDPANTDRHAGPDGDGHLGDLPVLEIGAEGRPTQRSLSAPRIMDVARLRGTALMVHEGGDNYADQPLPSGGGGARIACGVIG